MNRLLLILLILSTLLACQSDSQSSKDRVENTSEQNQNGIAISLQGNWLNKNYVNSIQSNQSPRLAQKTCEMCYLTIPASPNEMAEVVFNFHEIINYVLIQGKNNQFELWKGEANQPEQIVDSIIINSNDQITIGENSFIKINSTGNLSWFNILNELLFNDTYLNEEGEEIKFLKNGEVVNLDDYKFYAPQMDYIDEGRDVDQIMLGKTQDAMKPYAFKFKNKKLEIFALDCKSKDDGGNCVEVDFGKPLFKLKIK